jgi:hypothetical protein
MSGVLKVVFVASTVLSGGATEVVAQLHDGLVGRPTREIVSEADHVAHTVQLVSAFGVNSSSSSSSIRSSGNSIRSSGNSIRSSGNNATVLDDESQLMQEATLIVIVVDVTNDASICGSADKACMIRSRLSADKVIPIHVMLIRANQVPQSDQFEQAIQRLEPEFRHVTYMLENATNLETRSSQLEQAFAFWAAYAVQLSVVGPEHLAIFHSNFNKVLVGNLIKGMYASIRRSHANRPRQSVDR